jgi:glutamyl-tRNA synthetase
VGRSSAVFDEQKLRWMNGRFMRELPLDEYERRLADHLATTDPAAAESFAASAPERRRAACAIVQEKAQTLEEVWPLVRFLFQGPTDDAVAWERVMKPEARPLLAEALDALGDGGGFEPSTIEAGLRAVVDRYGVKPKLLFQPLRVAITGTTVSPGIFESLAALGRDESVARIERALARLPTD